MLKELYADPPYNVADELVKDSFTVIFLMIVNKLKLEDVKALVAKISDKDAYVMLKFIYMSWKRIAAGLEKVDKYCRSDILLKTHTLLVQKLGQCAVGRVLSDPLAL